MNPSDEMAPGWYFGLRRNPGPNSSQDDAEGRVAPLLYITEGPQDPGVPRASHWDVCFACSLHAVVALNMLLDLRAT